MLYTKTPFSKAIFELFSGLSEQLTEHGYNSPGCCKAFIFGGCAMHLHTNIRTSSDLDAQLSGAPDVQRQALELIRHVVPVDFDDETKGPIVLIFDETFNYALAPMHEDYDHRAIPLEVDNDSSVWVYLISKVDLAISKLGRYGDVDQSDIQALFDAGLSVEDFRQLVTELNSYAVGQTGLCSKMEHAISTYNDRRGTQHD